MSPRLIKIAAAATVVAALALGGAAWAVAASGDDDGPSATGPGAERAKAAALAHTGGGTANEVEAGDEEGAWEVEVTKPGGQTVDVHLDSSFHVIGTQGDSENEDAGGDD
jgi:Peptidase propeptide and YPEB domain